MRRFPVRIIGHRGAPRLAPENTLASFRAALAAGADGIELDVHLSRDGRPVVIHDPTLDRTTDGSGFVRAMTVAELKRFDAGSWFDGRFRGERIPLLEEVFETVSPGVLIDVEAKQSYGGEMERALAACLDEWAGVHDVIVSSFDHRLLCRLKRLRPETDVGLLYAVRPVTHMILAACMDGDVRSFHPDHVWLTAEDAAEMRASGYEVYPYTANRPVEWRRLIRMGVSGIITDDPGGLAVWMQRFVFDEA